MVRNSYTKLIGDFARRVYIEPARKRGETVVQVTAGEVQKGVHLSNRAPLVCQALKSRKFLEENDLVLERWDGPPSGMSTTVVFTYRLGSSPRQSDKRHDDPLMQLWGAGKAAFEKLGGGEAFLRRERGDFNAG